ncbi:hypothetical protein IKW75_00285 [Candidatus Saccharibacteria bacterium]|nr:hypothetical protein [Candidatus Saccharibacteria bacterium]
MPKNPSKPATSAKPTRFKHRSFRRSYHEDYDRPFEAPGLLAHAITSFKVIFRNWKLFLPLTLLIVVLNIALVGLMNEDTFVAFQNSVNETTAGVKNGEVGTFAKSGLLLISTITTGGLSTGTEAQQIFSFLLFLITWLVVIYSLRHILSSEAPIKLRDALYNALAPFISTLIVAAIIFIEAIPLMIVIITYAAAVNTNFLSTPFYALIYVIFAGLLITLSTYLISSSLVALIAVSAPGLYPIKAIRTASNLLSGRRIKFIIRVLYLIVVVGVFWALIMTPLIALDLVVKSTGAFKGFPFVSIELLIMTCFTAIYATTYLYLFYRKMLDYDDEKVLGENVKPAKSEKSAKPKKPTKVEKPAKAKTTKTKKERK